MSQVVDDAELAWQKQQEAILQMNGNGNGPVEPPEGTLRTNTNKYFLSFFFYIYLYFFLKKYEYPCYVDISRYKK